MEVICEVCQTRADFDEALLSARGTKVFCTTCGHRFTVSGPAVTVAGSSAGVTAVTPPGPQDKDAAATAAGAAHLPEPEASDTAAAVRPPAPQGAPSPGVYGGPSGTLRPPAAPPPPEAPPATPGTLPLIPRSARVPSAESQQPPSPTPTRRVSDRPEPRTTDDDEDLPEIRGLSRRRSSFRAPIAGAALALLLVGGVAAWKAGLLAPGQASPTAAGAPRTSPTGGAAAQADAGPRDRDDAQTAPSPLATATATETATSGADTDASVATDAALSTGTPSADATVAVGATSTTDAAPVAATTADAAAAPAAHATAATSGDATGGHTSEHASSGASSGRETSARGFDSLVAEGTRLRERGQVDRARALITAALAQRSGASDALTELGLIELDSGNPSAAITHLRSALAANPRYSLAYYGLGNAYSRQSNFRAALQAYRQYLEVSPNGSRANVVRALIETLERRVGERGEGPAPADRAHPTGTEASPPQGAPAAANTDDGT